MSLSLEDFYEDIIGKAQRGLNLSDTDLVSLADITQDQLEQAKEGIFDPAISNKLALPLHLNADALTTCGEKSWHPGINSLPSHFWQLMTDYKGVMTVNAYVVANPESKDALIFDSGADAQPILDLLQQHDLCASAILITHQHDDHVVEIPILKKKLDVPVFAVEEGSECDHYFGWGDTLQLAGFSVECRRTSGHAADGTTFSFKANGQPIAITGDALFAGSMGGANNHWPEALKYTREHILTLPEHTLLCPGHGPVTTVELERKYNPFFAEA